MTRVARVSFGCDSSQKFFGPVGQFRVGFGCAPLKSSAKDLAKRFEESLDFNDGLSLSETYQILIPYELL